jgi:peroxiredoxin
VVTVFTVTTLPSIKRAATLSSANVKHLLKISKSYSFYVGRGFGKLKIENREHPSINFVGIVQVTYRKMKKHIAFLFSIISISAHAQSKLKVGENFPANAINSTTPLIPNNNLKLVVITPTLTPECEYASMMTQAFYYYFVKKLAFKYPDTINKIDVVLITPNNNGLDTIVLPHALNQNITAGMAVIQAPNNNIFNAIGYPIFKNNNASSFLFLLDADNRIQLVDTAYRAQGEHLKPLEAKIKSLLNMPADFVKVDNPLKALKVGDAAPNVDLGNGKKLSDYLGQPVVLSFYPAAFSGTLTKPVLSDDYTLVENKAVKKKVILNSSKEATNNAMISCSIQIQHLDKISPIDLNLTKNIPKLLTISSATPEILTHWRSILQTHNTEFIDDPNYYSISQQFFSYNPKGYNNRTVFIIDKNGRIAFIDWAFDYSHEAFIKYKLSNLNVDTIQILSTLFKKNNGNNSLDQNKNIISTA